MKSTLFTLFAFVFICSILTNQPTSAANYQNPSSLPPANATAEEWAQFVKFLHNYYAIIARPRFGKRLDSGFVPTDRQPLYAILRRASERPSSLANQWSELFGEDQSIGHQDPLNFDDLYTYSQVDQRRRRR